MYIFEIHGIPAVQKQTRFSCVNNIPRAYNPSSKDIERIQWQIKATAPEEPLECAIELTLTFFMPITKSTSAIRRKQMINRIILPVVKPDFDNLAYLITNALKKIVYKDDNQVCAAHIYKYYSNEPRTIIQVRPISQITDFGHNGTDIR